MKKYYDKKFKRLVYIHKEATSDFWDEHWNVKDFRKEVLKGTRESLIFQITKKYLNKNARILEGGCGKGQLVYALERKGYDSYGIDYAKDTVTKINKEFPELKVSFGDVWKTEFPANYFEGYWSRGVIEHFFTGYEGIIQETHRILKPGGYMFITFPSMSPLRKLNAYFGKYPLFKENDSVPPNFFQFALDAHSVIRLIETHGFRLCEKKRYNGLKGLKEEVSFLYPFLEHLYKGRSFFYRAATYAISLLLGPFSGHSVLLVFVKK